MRVIGIDPGLATTGYGVVERRGPKLVGVAMGVIRTPSGAAQAERLVMLASALRRLIAEARPEAAAVERLFFNSNVRTAMAVGQASGVVMLALAEAGLEVTDYTPLEVKQSVVGVGNATKHQVQSMVAALLELPSLPKPADAADACALAICHTNRSGLARALATAQRDSAR